MLGALARHRGVRLPYFPARRAQRRGDSPCLPRPSLDNESEYFKCARCEAVMVRRNFRRISGVLIDVCRDHGVWLDAGELEQIRCFIANGGLDKSQDREIQKNSIEIPRRRRSQRPEHGLQDPPPLEPPANPLPGVVRGPVPGLPQPTTPPAVFDFALNP
ncbi:MAG: zf-TFIIB domain-containing protein [Deltaproteobacteria bacterium]